MKLVGILSQAARTCFERFLVPTIFATALAVYGIYCVLAEPEMDELVGAIGYFLSVGFVLSLSLTLWSEEHQWTVKDTVVHAVAYLVLIVDACYLYHIEFGIGGSGYEIFLMHASAIFALLLTVFFLSFNREHDDIPSWNFALRLFVSLIVCAIIGQVLWGGLSLLLGSMNWLFKVELGWKWYAVTGILIAGLLSVMLFLGLIPGGEKKHNREPLHSGFLAGVFRYLFLPLEALYIVVLFIYAIQILVRWELPNGQVSWLVIASMVGLIAIEFGLYPTRHADNRPFDHAVTRWLPLILTPLLLLMTIGIVRRFSDYGITVARLYLATLNVWFYIVCIGLFLTRARRIHWIPISFAALFLLTSALPINYTSLTRNVLFKQVERALKQAKVTDLPLNAERYDALMKALPQEEQNRISSKLSYLESTFNSETIEPLATQKPELILFRQYISEAGDSIVLDNMNNLYGAANFTHLHIPEGYTELYEDVVCHDFLIDLSRDTIEVPVKQAKSESVADTVIVSLKALRALDQRMNDLVLLPTKSSTNLFYLQQFNVYGGAVYDNGKRVSGVSEPKLNLTGYLLTKGSKENS